LAAGKNRLKRNERWEKEVFGHFLFNDLITEGKQKRRNAAIYESIIGRLFGHEHGSTPLLVPSLVVSCSRRQSPVFLLKRVRTSYSCWNLVQRNGKERNQFFIVVIIRRCQTGFFVAAILLRFYVAKEEPFGVDGVAAGLADGNGRVGRPCRNKASSPYKPKTNIH
jgi:hypothetical protein